MTMLQKFEVRGGGHRVRKKKREREKKLVDRDLAGKDSILVPSAEPIRSHNSLKSENENVEVVSYSINNQRHSTRDTSNAGP